MSIETLRKVHPWPTFKPLPHAIANLERGNVKKGLKNTPPLLKDKKEPVIVEMGSEFGGSARLFIDTLDNPTVICLDAWTYRTHGWDKSLRGITENKQYGMLAVFTHLCRNHKDNIICIRGDRLTGLKEVHKHEIKPDLVYVDCIHKYIHVLKDLELAQSLFPKTILCGDDWRMNHPSERFGVQRAVKEFAAKHGFTFIVYDNQYVINR